MQLIRVLLADDVPDIRDLLRLTVERDGRFEVVGEAGDGREAIQLSSELTPDIVVLDLAMPNMDGLQAIPEVRSHIGENGRIVVLSGFESERLAPQAIKTCADAYVEKGASSLRDLPEFLARVLAAAPKALAATG